MSEDRTTAGFLSLLGLIGDLEGRLNTAELEAGNARRAWQVAMTGKREASEERDTYRDKLYAVVNTLKDASEGKCICCRERPIGWQDIGLCTDCRLNAIRHGMPT